MAQQNRADFRTVSHTMSARLREKLRVFAFKHRVSESAVLEEALKRFFASGGDASLGDMMRDAGYSLRRAPARGRSTGA
jgi:hypothetical protein